MNKTFARFTDGPAAGQSFLIARAPAWIRVVYDVEARKWDCLDQLDDTPRPHELTYCYRAGPRSNSVIHIDRVVNGRREGIWGTPQSYHFETSPSVGATEKAK